MPRKPETSLTEDEKFALQEQQEQELQCLHRNYHLLEKDRELYSGGLRINRISKILTIFRKEYQNISVDLEVATAPAKKHQDAKDSDHLSKLLESYDECKVEIDKEKVYMKEMEDRIRNVEKNVVKLRSVQISDRQHELRTWAAIKTVEGLMNKMDVQNKKFGTICARNREMKQEINRMLWEREVFMKIWNKLISKLVLGKKFMLDLIEQASIAYDQREEWCSRLQALRMKAHQDFVSHTQEMRELKRRQDDNRKLGEFYNTKGMKRVMKDLEEKRKIEAIERKKILKEKHLEYRQNLDEIFQFTKQNKIEVIARQYHQQEGENLSLFNQVNNLNEELEVINDSLTGLHEEIEKERFVNSVRRMEHKNKLDTLEDKLKISTEALSETKKELVDVENYIEEMMIGIDSLFKLCHCHQDSILNLLGDNTKINIYTVFIYLEMIEHVVTKALSTVFQEEKILYDRKRLANSQRVILECTKKGDLKPLEKMVDTTPCPLCITREMVSDVIDTQQPVWTKRQARRMLRHRLKTPEFKETLHNVSKCFLPESREIVTRRYQ